MTKQFEDYAETESSTALTSSEADAATILGAIRFIQTRNIKGHQSALRELFTDPPAGKLQPQIVTGCLDAMISTSESLASTARFLASLATATNPLSMAGLAERSLWRLRPESNEALLRQLTGPFDGRRLKKIARLLTRLSGVNSPEPIDFWQEADATERARATGVWRERIR